MELFRNMSSTTETNLLTNVVLAIKNDLVVILSVVVGPPV